MEAEEYREEAGEEAGEEEEEQKIYYSLNGVLIELPAAAATSDTVLWESILECTSMQNEPGSRWSPDTSESGGHDSPTLPDNYDDTPEVEPEGSGTEDAGPREESKRSSIMSSQLDPSAPIIYFHQVEEPRTRQAVHFGTEWWMRSDLFDNLPRAAQDLVRGVQRAGHMTLDLIKALEKHHAERTTCAWTGLSWDPLLWSVYIARWQVLRSNAIGHGMMRLWPAMNGWKEQAREMRQLSLIGRFPVAPRFDFEMYWEAAEKVVRRYTSRMNELASPPTLESVQNERRELRKQGLLMTAREGGVPFPKDLRGYPD
ncbi:MAG: hypothetical protein M1837_006156 [Sclerophora amabilis]|nr:MAG: hypothetical protein M1837_006156 [Sclerophora amabilis]